MSNYADSKYGIVERQWFGLKKDWGGSGAAGFENASAETTFVKRWYPKGPIKLVKFGVLTAATNGATEMVTRLKKLTTVIATVVASTSSAPWTIASKAVTTVIDAGSYLAIVASSVSSASGTFACFVDYRRNYDASKHD